MSPRCSYRGSHGERCTRNGSGRPAFCRHHATIILAKKNPDLQPLVDVFGEDLLETADRFISQSRNQIVRNMRDRLGSFLSGMAGQHTAPPRQPRARVGAAPPPRPAPPPPPPPAPKEDPRAVLHFGPEEKLTADKIRKRQRKLAPLCHPDHGGSMEAMQRLNSAATKLLRMVS